MNHLDLDSHLVWDRGERRLKSFLRKCTPSCVSDRLVRIAACSPDESLSHLCETEWRTRVHRRWQCEQVSGCRQPEAPIHSSLRSQPIGTLRGGCLFERAMYITVVLGIPRPTLRLVSLRLPLNIAV